ncbi:MAG TPA: TetR/AcrR family transcriptional regulator [Solirubrobacteraceae bacterium]|nr:TetR/AcrR family transcriptional regulator [Solirubrobacteraceae bacterium]
MGSGRRTSMTAGGKRAERAKSGARKAAPRVAPLYKRLPHGPHRLKRDEVILNQRARIHGALIEAVAQDGYEGTSIKQVIGLAGVSRRSFYEQFANKEECFLVTFDLIARREIKQIRRAYLGAGGTLEERTRAAFERFAKAIHDDRKATILVLLEGQRAGPAGVLHLRNAAGACEQMLARVFTQEPGATPLPMPIVRGIAGGLHGMSASFIRQTNASRHIDLAEEMLRWTLLFQTPAAEHLGERMATGLSARMREISAAYGQGLHGAEAPSRDERTRLMQGVLRLVTHEDYRALSAPQIAEEANVSIDAFCELFVDKDQCFLAALDMIGDELLTIAADPDLVSDDWAHAVRRVLAELMRYLVNHPLQTRVLAQEAFFSGAEPYQRIVDLAQSIATLLTEGAPEPAQSALIVDAVAGAIWHTVRCQVAGGRIELLAALSDHLAYVVLAPFIGADAAIEIVTEERAPGSVSDAVCATPVLQST